MVALVLKTGSASKEWVGGEGGGRVLSPVKTVGGHRAYAMQRRRDTECEMEDGSGDDGERASKKPRAERDDFDDLLDPQMGPPWYPHIDSTKDKIVAIYTRAVTQRNFCSISLDASVHSLLNSSGPGTSSSKEDILNSGRECTSQRSSLCSPGTKVFARCCT